MYKRLPAPTTTQWIGAGLLLAAKDYFAESVLPLLPVPVPELVPLELPLLPAAPELGVLGLGGVGGVEPLDVPPPVLVPGAPKPLPDVDEFVSRLIVLLLLLGLW